MRYCENCKLRYPATSEYCQQCGTKLTECLETVDRQQVTAILKKLPGYKRILENCRIRNYEDEVFFDYILIHEAGIFAFQISESYRILEGSDKMRFWRVENTADHSVQMLERPVSVLERQQNILEQVLRRSNFAKTFAFLIYPDDSGLEKVSSAKMDQMLTVPRMKDILLRCIRDYGHVYSNADIDRLFTLLQASREHTPEPQRMSAAPIVNVDKPRHPVRTVLLAGMIAVLLLYSFSAFLNTRAHRQSQTGKPVTVNPLPQVAVTAYSIPARCAPLFSALQEADFDKVASYFDLASLTKQKDGALSVRVKAGNEQSTLSAMRSSLSEILTRLFDEGLLPNFTSVRTDNGMEFTVFVTSMDITEAENTLTEELLRFGALYAAISGAKPEEAAVSFYSQNGGLYRTVKAAD